MKLNLLTAATLTTSGLLAASAQAALVTGWTARAGENLSGASTASPVVGDGVTDEDGEGSIYATPGTGYTLSNVGDVLELSGSVTFTGNKAPINAANQFRWALYDADGNSGDTGWLGYFVSSAGEGGNAILNERDTSTTGSNWYMASAGGNDIATLSTQSEKLSDDTYDFLLTLERTAGGLQIDTSLIRDSDSAQFGLGSHEDTTPETYTFNRVAFLIGGALQTDEAAFSNVDVTFVPEPGSLALLGLGGLLVASRRRRD